MVSEGIAGVRSKLKYHTTEVGGIQSVGPSQFRPLVEIADERTEQRDVPSACGNSCSEKEAGAPVSHRSVRLWE